MKEGKDDGQMRGKLIENCLSGFSNMACTEIIVFSLVLSPTNEDAEILLMFSLALLAPNLTVLREELLEHRCFTGSMPSLTSDYKF